MLQLPAVSANRLEPKGTPLMPLGGSSLGGSALEVNGEGLSTTQDLLRRPMAPGWCQAAVPQPLSSCGHLWVGRVCT
jgi:hypothetical protein